MKISSPHKTFLPAITAFLLIIMSVGLIQAVKEMRENAEVQAFHLLKDSFLTPFQKKRNAGEFLNKLQKDINSLKMLSSSGNFPEINKIAESMAFTAADLKKVFEYPNRYIKIDTSRINPAAVLEITGICAKISNQWYNEDNLNILNSSLLNLEKQLTLLQNKFLSSGAGGSFSLITKTLMKHTLFSQDYLRKWESEIEKSSLIAGYLRSIMSWTQFKIFRATTEKVVEGKDGWFFYKRDIDYLVKPYITDQRSRDVDANDKPYCEDPLNAVIKFRDQLKELGIDLLVVMVPGKPSIYPEFLSSGASAHEIISGSHSRRFLRELNEHGVLTVDLYAPLLKARMDENPGEENLYLKKDTHWRSKGLRIAAKAVADKINSIPGIIGSEKSVEYMLDTVTVRRTGDILEMTKLMSSELKPFRVEFEDEAELCYQVYETRQDSSGNLIKKSLIKNDFRKSDILILGDSFSRIYQSDAPTSAGWVSHLAYELKVPIASIESNGGASTLVRQKLARKKNVLKGKKLVVWAFVERDLRYGEEGWRNVDL